MEKKAFWNIFANISVQGHPSIQKSFCDLHLFVSELRTSGHALAVANAALVSAITESSTTTDGFTVERGLLRNIQKSKNCFKN